MKEPTKQSIFNKVAIHLLTQMKKSVSRGYNCKYRSANHGKTLMCAIGCLIPDELYDPKMDRNQLTASQLVLTKKQLHPYLGTDIDFLTKLQHLHDLNRPEQWKDALGVIAIKYNLSQKVFEKLG